MQTPPSDPQLGDIDREAALAAMTGAAKTGRAMLTEPEAKSVLEAYGIATVPTRIARDADEVEEIVRALLENWEAVALKILSRDISHKSDVGGVKLDLATPRAARAAAEAMLKRVADAKPQARLEGVTVQPMIVRPRARELILGVSEDALFGPVILFGSGGVEAEIVDDTAVGLPPLDMKLARELMARTRVFRLLQGYRDRPPADLDAIMEALVRLSQLVVERPEIRELDINPLLADAAGVIALDARIRIEPEEVPAQGLNPRLAMRPYPSQWERDATTASGLRAFIRPIRPADEHLYGAFIEKLDPEDIRFRFLAPKKEFSHRFIARFTQIDYARAMAFVALSGDQTELLGVARLAADPDYTSAEYAVIVRSDLKGAGLGWVVMQHLIDYARAERLSELYGSVLAGNAGMLKMCRELGFEIRPADGEPGLFEVSLALSQGRAATQGNRR